MTGGYIQRYHLRRQDGLRRRDASKDQSHKMIYNRLIRLSRLGVFNRIFATLSAKGGKHELFQF